MKMMIVIAMLNWRESENGKSNTGEVFFYVAQLLAVCCTILVQLSYALILSQARL